MSHASLRMLEWYGWDDLHPRQSRPPRPEGGRITWKLVDAGLLAPPGPWRYGRPTTPFTITDKGRAALLSDEVRARLAYKVRLTFQFTETTRRAVAYDLGFDRCATRDEIEDWLRRIVARSEARLCAQYRRFEALDGDDDD